MKKIAVIGHFGFGGNYLDGQTVKTKIVTEELQNQLGLDQVLKIDTHGGKKVLPKLFFQTVLALRKAKNVVMLPAHNGIKFFTPILIIFNKIFKRKLFYIVIGGWLSEYLKDKRNLEKCLKKFDGIFVETNTMKASLENMGFKNISVMPNCKKLKKLTEEELVYPIGEPYKLCTFSRVCKEKGIESAVNAVKIVNEKMGRIVYTLDIYGQVDEKQTEWFDSLRKEFPTYIRYGGLVPFDKSVETLKYYFALLFPTYYDGEGFAGTLIDSFSAGVPVIATDWKYNAELVNENVGFVYPTGDQQFFVDILKKVAKNPALLLCKKRLCLIEVDKYKIDNAVRSLIEQMNS